MNKFIISLITIILFISCKKVPLETVRIEAENIPDHDFENSKLCVFDKCFALKINYDSVIDLEI